MVISASCPGRRGRLAQIGLVDVGPQPYIHDIRHSDDGRAGGDVLARLDVLRQHDARQRRGHLGVAELNFSGLQTGFGLIQLGPGLIDDPLFAALP